MSGEQAEALLGRLEAAVAAGEALLARLEVTLSEVRGAIGDGRRLERELRREVLAEVESVAKAATKEAAETLNAELAQAVPKVRAALHQTQLQLAQGLVERTDQMGEALARAVQDVSREMGLRPRPQMPPELVSLIATLRAGPSGAGQSTGRRRGR